MKDNLRVSFTKRSAKLTLSQINIVADDQLSIGNM